MRLSEQIMEDGRRRLAALLPYVLPLARKQALKEAKGLSPRTLLGQSITSRLQLSHLDALTVHRDHQGAWHAGLHLSGLPRGYPAIISTPEDKGLLAERTARKACTRLLLKALVEVRHNELARRDHSLDDDRIFRLGELEFSIPGVLVDRLSKTGSNRDRSALGHECLFSAIAEIGTDRITQQAWSQAPSVARMRAYKGMTLLLTAGQTRHSIPPGKSSSPKR